MTSEPERLGEPGGLPDGIDRPVALITGCSSGFGLRTVPALVRNGFHVVATMRDLSRRNALDAALPVGLAGHASVLRLDVRRPDTIERCVRAVLAATGRIDVLVNNAGLAPPNFLEEAPLDQWREVFETNVFGRVAVTNAVLPSMRARGRGRVIMLSSVGGRVPDLGLGVYSSSKFALEGYAETLRMELRRKGVQVLLVEPGAFATNIYDSPLPRADPDPASPYAADFARLRDFYREYVDHHLADPERVAELIAALAVGRSRRLRYLIGTDARLKVLLHAVLPWAAYERVARRLVGLPS